MRNYRFEEQVNGSDVVLPMICALFGLVFASASYMTASAGGHYWSSVLFAVCSALSMVGVFWSLCSSKRIEKRIAKRRARLDAYVRSAVDDASLNDTLGKWSSGRGESDSGA